jgi:hypothetical protein
MGYDFDPQIANWEGEGGAEPRPSQTVIEAAEQLIDRGMTDHAIRKWEAEATHDAQGGAQPPERLL